MLLLAYLSLLAVDPPADLDGNILPDRCRAASVREDEVVVCGRRNRQSPYRIRPQPPVPPALPDAHLQISEGVEARLSAEQGEVGGIPTNRTLVTLKVKF